jgi:polygalacturonase
MHQKTLIFRYAFTVCLLFVLSSFSYSVPVFYNISDYGAKGDSLTLNTLSIQSAIDECARAGGGTVYFPAGKYISGTLFFRSHITLHLAAGAVLVGSSNLDDYPVTVANIRSYTDNYTDKSLIYAEGLINIGLIGQGRINGNGSKFSGPYKVRPFMIRIINCKNVLVRDVTLMDSPMWLQHYLACENVIIDGITVNNRHDHINNDGIDIDGCNEVRISNCRIISGDDAIVMKSTLNRACKDITITNCIISTNSNAIKIGSETTGNFENIVISNCSFYDTHLGGIALQIMDGGTINGVSVSNIVMNEVGTAILIRLGNRGRPFNEHAPKPGVGMISNIMFNNIQANNTSNLGCSISGLPGYPVKNISLNNIRLTFPGGGTVENANREIPDSPTKYPDVRMFGILPAYAFFCRHAENLTFDDVEMYFTNPDLRSAVACEDINGLEFYKIKAMSYGIEPVIRCRNVKDMFVQACKATPGIDTYLQITGEKSESITMSGNDLRGAKNGVKKDQGIVIYTDPALIK